MGFRIRKSIGSGGFKVNISKSGVGYSYGVKGMRYTKKANGGTRTTISIPKTGISYIHDSSIKEIENSQIIEDDVNQVPVKTNGQKANNFKAGFIVLVIFTGLLLLGSIGMFAEKSLNLTELCGSMVLTIGLGILSLYLYKKYKTYENLAKEDGTLVLSNNEDSEVLINSDTNNNLLEQYNNLLQNDYSVELMDSNFNCSLAIMALNTLIKNPNYKEGDLSFNIDDKIKELSNYGQQLFLNSDCNSFVALDTETTGLDPENDRILQIALIKVENGKFVDSFVSLVNPKVYIPVRASEINGIYKDDVKNAKTIKELFPDILKFIGNYPLIMHNASFDMKFLENEYSRNFNKLLPNLKNICTMKLWKKLFFKYQNEKVPAANLYTLVLNLLQKNEIEEYENNKHTAECDAISTAKVFMKMYDNTVNK